MSVKQNGRVLRAIQWNAAEREPNLVAKKDAVEIAYTVEENEYMGNKYVELRLDDFRLKNARSAGTVGSADCADPIAHQSPRLPGCR